MGKGKDSAYAKSQNKISLPEKVDQKVKRGLKIPRRLLIDQNASI